MIHKIQYYVISLLASIFFALTHLSVFLFSLLILSGGEIYNVLTTEFFDQQRFQWIPMVILILMLSYIFSYVAREVIYLFWFGNIGNLSDKNKIIDLISLLTSCITPFIYGEILIGTGNVFNYYYDVNDLNFYLSKNNGLQIFIWIMFLLANLAMNYYIQAKMKELFTLRAEMAKESSNINIIKIILFLALIGMNAYVFIGIIAMTFR